MTRREWQLLLLATLALTLLWTAPWLRVVENGLLDARSQGQIQEDSDAQLVIWTLAWQAHAVRTNPASFFDANIFHPSAGTLLGSDLFVSPALLAAPIYWVSNNAILAANLLAIAGYGLCFLLGYLLVRRSQGTPLAATLAGIAIALGPFRVPPSLHALQYSAWLLPLVLLLWARAEERANATRWLLLALGITLGLFTSVYMAAMVVVLLACEALTCWAQRGFRTLPRLLSAALPGGAALLAYARLYLGRAGEPGVTPVDTQTSFEVVGRLMQGAYIDPSHPIVGVGWIVLALAVLGVVRPLLERRPPGRFWWRWVLLLLAGLSLSVGPQLELGNLRIPMAYSFLLETPLRALRAFPRFFILAHLGVVGLAALGTDLLWKRLDGRQLAAGVVACLLVVGVALPRTLLCLESPYRRIPLGTETPAVYRELASRAPGPLLEIPGPPTAANLEQKFIQSQFMVQSTEHWRPLLNGHTGYPPWTWQWLGREIYLIPDFPEALRAVAQATGVRWIVVHPEHLTAREWKRWQKAVRTNPDLSGAEEIGGRLLIPVDLPGNPDWQAAIRNGRAKAGQTLLGTPRTPLDPTSTRGSVRLLAGPGPIPPSSKFNLQIQVENLGATTWPALAPDRAPLDGLVVLEGSWEGEEPNLRRKLMRDVFPGEAQQQWLEFEAPQAPGDHLLTLRLRQVNGSRFHSSPPLVLPITVTAPGDASAPGPPTRP